MLAASAAAAKKAYEQLNPIFATKVSVPVDAFKAFCVYEDENQQQQQQQMPDRGAPDGCDVSLDSTLNISAIR